MYAKVNREEGVANERVMQPLLSSKGVTRRSGGEGACVRDGEEERVAHKL